MIHHGDLFDVLPTLKAESIDACVTDPPYGIGFMGKEWDTFKPEAAEALLARKTIRPDEPIGRRVRRQTNPNLKGRTLDGYVSQSAVAYDYSAKGLQAFEEWTERWATEVFRVLKPGAHMVVCGAPRAYHRMACGIEDAGFEIRDCFAWLFGSGFPKSLNLGGGLGTALKPAHEPIVLARKPFKGSVRANVEKHGTGALNIDACRIRFASKEDQAAAAAAAAAQRAGQDQNARRTCYGDFNDGPGSIGPYLEKMDLGRWPANVVLDEIAAMVLDEQSGELVSGANPERRGSDKFRGIYSAFAGQEKCEAARGVDVGGASRFYKICSPGCVLCGLPIVNHDTMSGCETTSVSSVERRSRIIHQTIASIAPNSAVGSLAGKLALAAPFVESLCARCVTSIALALAETRCSDSESAVSRVFRGSMPSYKSSILSRSLASFVELWGNTDITPTTASLSLLFGSVCRAIESSTRPANDGRLGNIELDQPRFRYSPKPSREERDMGCYDLPPRTAGEATDREDGTAGLDNPGAGAGRTGGARNIHPTVKPVELMRWLVRLVTPPGGVVLDPFTGSGTTGMACRYELREFIGIEREAEYVAIAERRIAAVAPLFGSAGVPITVNPSEDSNTGKPDTRDLFSD